MPRSLLEDLGWRTRPGILGRHPASVQSVHALLGYFLKDRGSPTPFPGRDELVHAHTFDWGVAPPLEKVIERPAELELLLGLPELFRQSVSIVEPWPNVGVNLQNEAVRASKNVAYILQQVADADSILYPVWQSGIAHPQRLANVLSAGMATVFEGGNPSVYDPASFDGANLSLEDLLALVDQLLLRRSAESAPTIFICLGHQLAAASHIRLIKRAVREVLALEHNIRRSFTCQFHPELMADIRDIGRRAGPRYRELKENDGVRLFIRLLYHGMQE